VLLFIVHSIADFKILSFLYVTKLIAHNICGCNNHKNELYVILVFSLVVPTEAPVIISLISESPFSMNISWEPPPLDHHNGLIVTYHLVVTDILTAHGSDYSKSTPGRAMNISVAASSNPYLINNLVANQTYTVRIAAATRVGVGPFSVELNETTQEDGKFVDLVLTCMCR